MKNNLTEDEPNYLLVYWLTGVFICLVAVMLLLAYNLLNN